MGTRLEFLTQNIVDRASAGKMDAEIEHAMVHLSAVMLFPKDADHYAAYMGNAFVEKEMRRFDAITRPSVKDWSNLRQLLRMQRSFTMPAELLRVHVDTAMRNGHARGVLFREALKLGSFEKAAPHVSQYVSETFDPNFRRKKHFIPVSHLWAAYSAFVDDRVLPCRPQHLAEFLSIARAFQIALEESGKAEAEFRIPDGLRLKSYMLRTVGERAKNDRFQPRRLERSQEVRV